MGGWGGNFLLFCVHHIPLLILFNIEWKRLSSGGGGRKAGVFWGGG